MFYFPSVIMKSKSGEIPFSVRSYFRHRDAKCPKLLRIRALKTLNTPDKSRFPVSDLQRIPKSQVLVDAFSPSTRLNVWRSPIRRFCAALVSFRTQLVKYTEQIFAIEGFAEFLELALLFTCFLAAIVISCPLQLSFTNFVPPNSQFPDKCFSRVIEVLSQI